MLLLVTSRPRTMSAFGGGSAAGPSHSRHFATTLHFGRFRGEAEVGRAAEFAASVETDPTETSDGLCNATRTLAAITLGALADR